MHAHENGGGSIHRRDLFESNQIRRGLETKPFVFFREKHSEEANLAQLLHNRRIEPRLMIKLGGKGRDLTLRKVAREGLNLSLLFGQVV